MRKEPKVFYRALAGLDYPRDKGEAHRIAVAKERGKPIPLKERKMLRLEAGEITDWLPAESLPWLIEQGLVRVEEVEQE